MTLVLRKAQKLLYLLIACQLMIFIARFKISVRESKPQESKIISKGKQFSFRFSFQKVISELLCSYV